MTDMKMAGSSEQARARAAVVVLLIGATTIGFAPILVKWSQLDPCAIAAWRLLMAAGVLAAEYREQVAEFLRLWRHTATQ